MGVKRSFSSKPRGKVTKTRKPIILIATEGKNKTEKTYFNHFNSRGSKYSVKPFSTGDTDPAGMLKALKRRCADNEISAKNGDLACIALDLDCKEEKAAIIRDLSAKGVNAPYMFVVSNPCFEVWFLDHFRFSTKSYMDQEDVISELKNNYISNYDKNLDVFDVLLSRLNTAIRHEEQLHQYHAGVTWPSAACTPKTDMLNIIHNLLERAD